MTSIKEALRIARGYIADDVTRKPSEYDPRADLRAIDAALAQLDSADARSGNLRRVVLDLLNGVTPAVENLACHQEQADADGCMVKVSRQALDEVLSAVNEVAVQAATSLSTGLLPDASPGNGAEKVREALGRLLVEDDSDEADDECELCGGRGTVDAYTDRASGSFEGRDEIGCPSCIERSHSRQIRAALHSTSAAGETTSSDGGGCMADFSSGDPNNLKELMAGPSVFDPPSEAADVLAMKEACKRAVSECLNQYGRMTFVTEKGWSGLEGQILAAIDKLSPEVKAEGGPPDWKQDQAETTRIKPPATAEGGRDEPVAIKPLEWRDHRPDSFPEPAWSAQTPFGYYNIEEVSASDSPAYVVRLHAHHFIADKDSLEDAKGAAQADYEQRIRSALVVHPASPPDVEAIRADERERCATEVERRNWPTVGDARRIASAIRTGGQK